MNESLQRSSWRRAWDRLVRGVRSPRTERRAEEAEDAIKLALVGKRRAEVDADTAAAVSELAASVKDVSQACVRAGSLFLVKYTDRNGEFLQVIQLSPRQIAALERFPEILCRPAKVMSALAMITDSWTDDTTLTIEVSGGRAENPLPVRGRRRQAAGVALEVRTLAPGDWRVLRDLRLAALQDAPSAFCSTYEDAQRRDEAGWRAWPKDGSAFAVWLAGEPVGMVGVSRRTDEPHLADLIAMWVAPDARGSGAADALIEAVLAWAENLGCRAVHLEVAPGNPRAERAYARNGFVAVDVPTTMTGGVAMRLTFG